MAEKQIKISIQFNGKSLTIPVNPEELSITRTAENDDIDIVGIGPASRKGPPGLYTITIESFFPGKNSYYYTNVNPNTCVKFIEDIWKTPNKKNLVAKLVTAGLPKNINIYFVIEEFDWTYKAGEESDIYFSLKIKQYRPYGVKTIKIKKATKKTKKTKVVKTKTKSRTSSTVKKTKKQNTYKVKKGDCLWNISKKFSGKGSNWKELYKLNKKVVGSNPNLIYPGQILKLPTNW